MMLSALIPSIVNKRIILASSSPRRRNLLPKLGLTFSVQGSDFPENLNKCDYIGKPGQYCVDNAKFKALDVFEKLVQQQSCPDLVIGCDTVVSLDGKIIEKPRDKEHALDILLSLNDREHQVYSGVCLISNERKSEPRIETFFEESTVKFGSHSEEVYRAYIETGEPADKAGGYGIQDYGAVLVESIRGDFYNVEGLPLYKLSKELIKLYSSH